MMKKITDKIMIIIKSVITIFLFFYSSYLQYIPLLLFHIDKESVRNNIKVQVLLSLFSYLILLIILFFMYREDIIKEFRIFVKKIRENMDIGLSSWVTGLLIMFVSNMILVSFFHSEGANNETVVRTMIHGFPIVMGLEVCILVPIIEEIVFRKTIKDVFKNVYVFIFLSFLIFGLAHVASMATSIVDWLYIIPYGALGGAFAFAYHKTDSVFTSITFHMIHNTIVFLLTISVL